MKNFFYYFMSCLRCPKGVDIEIGGACFSSMLEFRYQGTAAKAT